MQATLQKGESLNTGRNKAFFVLFTLLFTILSIMATGYHHDAGSNHPLQLILVQKLHNPDLYPNDDFVRETAFAYASALWYLIAQLALYFDLTKVLFVVFLISRVLLMVGAARLGRAFFPDSPFAPYVAMIFIATIPQPLVGAGNPIKNYAEQTTIALAFIFLSLSFFLEGRFVWTGVLLGLAFDMNSMYAGFALVYLITSIVFVKEYRKDIKKWVFTVLGALLIGFPGLYLAIKAGWGKPFNEEASWMAAEIEMPYHFFPQTWTIEAQILLLGLMAISWLLAYRLARPLSPKSLVLGTWTWVALLWYLIAWINPYLLHSFFLLRLHPIRGHDIWMYVFGIFMASMMFTWFVKKRNEKLFINLTMFLILFISIFWYVLRYLSISNIIVIISGVVGFIIIYNLNFIRNRWEPAIAGLLTILLMMRTGAIYWRGVQHTGNWLRTEQIPCRQAAEWAARATSPEDVFIVPAGLEEGWIHFRHLAQRNVFGTWKDGTSWPYAPWYAEKWLTKMKELGLFEIAGLREDQRRLGDWTWVREKYCNIFYRKMVNEDRVLNLSKKYRIDYWVTYKEVPTKLPVVYQYGDWKILKVK